ncbi:hypothetical protein ABZT17_12185 [Streptomyces sp. NPDC005648]|uniref:hypothetical protein n=1 Tax=Streptomyces sp. NPDC005648 TaxID=3157044 RepID=UPI0033B51B0A
MTRPSNLLCSAYIGLFLWLLYCAVQSARHGAWWATVVFVVGTCLAMVAFLREDQLDDLLRREAVRAEREARPVLTPDETADGVVAVALAGECCDRWWTSAGADHDPTCRRQTPESSAA